MTTIVINRLILGGIVLGYWLVAGLFAIRTPDWQAPDEPAHYNYVAQIAEQGVIPTIEMGDWDSDYLQLLTSTQFDPANLDALDTVQYEDHQPPLYYVLLSPVFSLTDGNLTVLRLFSMLIGTIIIISAYGVGRVLYPETPWIGLGASAFVAFLPQHVAILASVNNDALGWALMGLMLWATVHYLKFDRVKAWHLGVLVGIGLITKATTYFMAGVIPLAILLKWMQNTDKRDYRALAMLWAQYLIVALAFGLLWWVRNIDVYGFPDFLGLIAHDEVVIGQTRTADTIADIGLGAYLEMGASTTFNSFWGQFGWMAVPLQTRWYLVIDVILVIVAGGLAVRWYLLPGLADITDVSEKPPTPTEHRNAWIVLILTIALSILAYIYYNLEFQQFQGRYMFTMLIPLGVLFALGLDGWRQFIMRWLNMSVRIETFAPYIIILPFVMVAIWDIWLLWRVIVPNL